MNTGRAIGLTQFRLLQLLVKAVPGADIVELYENTYGYDLTRGTLYSTLSSLRQKGYALSKPMVNRPGRKYYVITAPGQLRAHDTRYKLLTAVRGLSNDIHRSWLERK